MAVLAGSQAVSDFVLEATATRVYGRQRRYRLPRSRRLGGRGESFAFEASDVHRVSHAGGAPALTVHLYSPPLRQMGAYLIEPSGLVRRITISHEQELRPLTPA